MEVERDIALYFLHGSGGTGQELRIFLQSVPIAEFDNKTFYQLLQERGIDLVTPTAPKRSYMPCGGEEMNVWFNRSPTVFHRGTLDSYEDVKGIEESMSAILEHITASGQEYKQVIVGGFSMGGGLALYLLGRSYLPDSLRGVFSMGSFIIDGTSLFQQPRDGEDDTMIRSVWGAQTGAFLTLRGFDVHHKTYRDLDHEIGVQELVDLIYWVDDVIQSDYCIDAENRRAMDEAMEKYTDDFMDVDHKAVVDAREPMPVRPPAASTVSITHVPFTISPVQTDNSTSVQRNECFVIHYSAPQELISVLSSRPVLACGSEFAITPTTNGVQCIIQSSDPEKTATEIGKRLLSRMNSGESELNMCPMM